MLSEYLPKLRLNYRLRNLYDIISSDYRIKKPEPEIPLGLMGENQLNPAEQSLSVMT